MFGVVLFSALIPEIPEVRVQTESKESQRCIQCDESVTWFAMLDTREPCFDHLTASAHPCPTVFSSVLFTFRQSVQRDSPASSYIRLFKPLRKNRKVMVDHL